MALGMLLVIVSGHIDLSVGSVVGFIGALAAMMMVNWPLGPSTSLATIICLIAGGGHRRGARLLDRLSPHTVLHRHAGRHAGLPRPDAGAAERRSVGPFPRGIPVAELRLHSGILCGCSIPAAGAPDVAAGRSSPAASSCSTVAWRHARKQVKHGIEEEPTVLLPAKNVMCRSQPSCLRLPAGELQAACRTC
jgi:putative multiple sugar transport system permease protein